MIEINDTTTIRELAAKYPATLDVLEKFGIDYCCGGGERLVTSVARRGISMNVLRLALEEAIENPPTGAEAVRNWAEAPLTELADHIEAKHHAFMREQLQRLANMGIRVMRAHGERHGEMLEQVQRVFESLRLEIEAHLEKEEQILFPFIRQIETAADTGRSLPEFHCGTIEHPIERMELEHENAGHALARIRELTGDYALPEGACSTFAAYYEGLQELEADLHEHIHLENNILFPRAIAMETAMAVR